MSCLICNSKKIVKSYYPNNVFNNKIYKYDKCLMCGLIYINPLPLKEDFDLIYNIKYQKDLNGITQHDNNTKLPGLRYNYNYHFNKINKYSIGNVIADFGCGNGDFIEKAIKAGYICDGVEYNEILTSVLKNNIINSNFYTIDAFFNSEKKYDVIRMSNVLEHLVNPKNIISQLTNKLNKNGILIVEGPLEDNFTLFNYLLKLYFKVKLIFNPNFTTHHPPTHLFFTNSLNQKKMLEHENLILIFYDIKEESWPLPEKIAVNKGVMHLLKGLLSKLSITLSKLNSNAGNTFIYIGKKI